MPVKRVGVTVPSHRLLRDEDLIVPAKHREELAERGEALVALDLLLSELQNDAVPMAELQQHYRRGEIYLDHCEALLNTLEQSVVELDPDTLEPNDDA